MFRILVISTQIDPHIDQAGAKSRVSETVLGLLARDHGVSVLVGDRRTAAGVLLPEIDRRLAVRRQLKAAGPLRTLRNYLITSGVCDVAMPEIAIAWHFSALTASPLRAAMDYGATGVVYLTPDLVDLKPGIFAHDLLMWPRPTLRDLRFHAFCTDAGVRDTLAGQGLPVGDAPVFSEEEVMSCGEDFERWLGKVRLAHRFDRYEEISKYKQNPRPFMRVDTSASS